LQAAAGERTIHDVRRMLKELLAQLPPVAYLVDETMAKTPQPIESLQAPIFDPEGIPRYALTVNVNSELDSRAVARMGRRVRAAANEVSAALASHARLARGV
jgi:hypothetical protein